PLFRLSFAMQSGSQTALEVCGRVKAQSLVSYSRLQTANSFVALGAGMTILKVLLDLQALHQVHRTLEIAMQQITRLLATQCLPPCPCAGRATPAVVCVRAPTGT